MDSFRKIAAAIMLAAIASAFNCKAQTFMDRHWTVGANAVYGYNCTQQHYGGANIQATLPIHKYFQMEASLQALSNSSVATSVTARPVLPVGSSEFYLDATLLCNPYTRQQSMILSSAFLLGYRHDYVNVQLGIANNWLYDTAPKAGKAVFEPALLQYRLELCARPSSSPWNIGGGITNFSQYKFERVWQPSLFAEAYADISRHLRFNTIVYLMPDGAVSLTTSSYSVICSAGLSYMF